MALPNRRPVSFCDFFLFSSHQDFYSLIIFSKIHGVPVRQIRYLFLYRMKADQFRAARDIAGLKTLAAPWLTGAHPEHYQVEVVNYCYDMVRVSFCLWFLPLPSRQSQLPFFGFCRKLRTQRLLMTQSSGSSDVLFCCNGLE